MIEGLEDTKNLLLTEKLKKCRTLWPWIKWQDLLGIGRFSGMSFIDWKV